MDSMMTEQYYEDEVEYYDPEIPQEPEQIDENVRGGLMKTAGVVMVVCLSVLAPSMWIKDTFLNKETLNFVYDNDGYIIRIKDKKGRTIWKK